MLAFLSTNGGGNCVNTAPDMCKTPTPGGPVPMPYPNMGMNLQAIKFSTKVKACMRNAAHKKTEIPLSNGDQPGTLLGVKSNMVMNKIKWLTYSSKVKIEGKAAVYHLATTGHNGSNQNIPGKQVAPSQVMVKVAK